MINLYGNDVQNYALWKKILKKMTDSSQIILIIFNKIWKK